MKNLTRFWFTFQPFLAMNPLNLGCGVTGFDYNDALYLLRERVFIDGEIPALASHIENVSLLDLEQSHVLPNIGLIGERGIWFPVGYRAPMRT